MQSYPYDHFEVDEVFGKKVVNKKDLYLVKWLNYDSRYNTWEPESSFEHCPRLIKKFNKKLHRISKQTKTKVSGAVKLALLYDGVIRIIYNKREGIWMFSYIKGAKGSWN